MVKGVEASHMRQTAVRLDFSPMRLANYNASQKNNENVYEYMCTCMFIGMCMYVCMCVYFALFKSHLQPRLGLYGGNKVTCNNKFKVFRKTEKFNQFCFYLNVLRMDLHT